MSLMLKEIAEQPVVLEKTIKAETEKMKKIGKFLHNRDIDLVVLVARGSSDNAALFGRYLIETICGIPVSLAAPSVYTLYKAKLNLNRALVVGVSQSGEGSDINTCLEEREKIRRIYAWNYKQSEICDHESRRRNAFNSRRKGKISCRNENVYGTNAPILFAGKCSGRKI